MKTIYKYPLSINDSQVVELPVFSSILSVQFQNGTNSQLCLWAMVDTDNELKPRTFRIFGTGANVETKNTLLHISTIQMGSIVLHVFEEFEI